MRGSMGRRVGGCMGAVGAVGAVHAVLCRTGRAVPRRTVPCRVPCCVMRGVPFCACMCACARMCTHLRMSACVYAYARLEYTHTCMQGVHTCVCVRAVHMHESVCVPVSCTVQGCVLLCLSSTKGHTILIIMIYQL